MQTILTITENMQLNAVPSTASYEADSGVNQYVLSAYPEKFVGWTRRLEYLVGDVRAFVEDQNPTGDAAAWELPASVPDGIILLQVVFLNDDGESTKRAASSICKDTVRGKSILAVSEQTPDFRDPWVALKGEALGSFETLDDVVTFYHVDGSKAGEIQLGGGSGGGGITSLQNADGNLDVGVTGSVGTIGFSETFNDRLAGISSTASNAAEDASTGIRLATAAILEAEGATEAAAGAATLAEDAKTAADAAKAIADTALQDTPNDGNLYARMGGAWHALNNRTKIIYVDAGSTEDMEDGSIDFPYKDLPAAVVAAPFGSAIEVAPGVYSGFNMMVENVAIWTPGANGQFRAQVQGSVNINAVRAAINGLQITGVVTVSAELAYLESVDVGSLVYDSSGYSKLLNCYIETTCTVNDGTLGLTGVQFEASQVTDVNHNGGSILAVDTTGMNVLRGPDAGALILREGCTCDRITDDAEAGPLILMGGGIANVDTLQIGIIQKTGSAPWFISGTVYDLGNSVLSGPRLPYGSQFADTLAGHDAENYVPTSVFGPGHLAGIDAKLGTLEAIEYDYPIAWCYPQSGFIGTTFNDDGTVLQYPGGVVEYFTLTGRGVATLSATNITFVGGQYLLLDTTANTVSAGPAPAAGAANQHIKMIGGMSQDGERKFANINGLSTISYPATDPGAMEPTPIVRFAKAFGGTPIVAWSAEASFSIQGGLVQRITDRDDVSLVSLSAQALQYTENRMLIYNSSAGQGVGAFSLVSSTSAVTLESDRYVAGFTALHPQTGKPSLYLYGYGFTSWWDNRLDYPIVFFMARTGRDPITWTSRTTFNFNGGGYIRILNRGQTGGVTLTETPVSYSIGTLILYNPDTNEFTTRDSALITNLEAPLCVAGYMGPNEFNEPSVTIWGNGQTAYEGGTGTEITRGAVIDADAAPIDFYLFGDEQSEASILLHTDAAGGVNPKIVFRAASGTEWEFGGMAYNWQYTESQPVGAVTEVRPGRDGDQSFDLINGTPPAGNFRAQGEVYIISPDGTTSGVMYTLSTPDATHWIVSAVKLF